TQGNYWRSGQLAATVIPIVLTGGELAATKIKGWIKGTDKAANLLKTAKKLEQTAGNTVNVIDEAGNVKTITLEGDELVVREVAKAGKVIYPSVKINGVPVVRLMTGTNNKIAIIGRKMEYVRQIGSDLKKLGKEVELFEKATAFNGQGYSKLAEIEADWQKALDLYGNNGVIPYEKLKTTLWYKENQRWAKWIKEQGYDIYDLGDNPGIFTNAPDRSAFYDIEKVEVFGDIIK
ncbi:MAG: hypothetical protein WBP45_10265, partial [Daejeonella sp.]